MNGSSGLAWSVGPFGISRTPQCDAAVQVKLKKREHRMRG